MRVVSAGYIRDVDMGDLVQWVFNTTNDDGTSAELVAPVLVVANLDNGEPVGGASINENFAGDGVHRVDVVTGFGAGWEDQKTYGAFLVGGTVGGPVDGKSVNHLIVGLFSIGLTPDLLKRATPGHYAAGSAGHAIGRIAAGNITVQSVVSYDGRRLFIKRGDSYSVDDGNPIVWTDTDAAFPSLSGFDLFLKIGAADPIEGAWVNPTAMFEVSISESAALEVGTVAFEVYASKPGSRITLIEGIAVISSPVS